MANILYANNAVGTLAAAITNTATSITLNSGQASLFPNPSSPQVFYATLTDAATQTLKEIVQVTAVSGNIFSVVRAQDGTTALSWNQNDIIELCAIRLEMQNWENAAEGLFSTLAVAIVPSTTLGIVGTILGDNANAGSVGEYVSSSFSSVTIPTNATPINATSISLSPGDWDVTGSAMFEASSSATVSAIVAGLSTTSSTLPSVGLYGQNSVSFTVTGAGTLSFPIQRINVTTTTTVYGVVEALFTGGTALVNGFLRARRVR